MNGEWIVDYHCSQLRLHSSGDPLGDYVEYALEMFRWLVEAEVLILHLLSSLAEDSSW